MGIVGISRCQRYLGVSIWGDYWRVLVSIRRGRKLRISYIRRRVASLFFLDFDALIWHELWRVLGP